MRILLPLIIVVCAFMSCDDSSKTKIIEPHDMQLVSGINCTDGIGTTLLILGNPNDTKPKLIASEGITGSNVQTAAYPNPVVNLLYIHSTHNIQSVWVITGEPSKQYQNFDFEAYFQTNTIDTTDIHHSIVFSNTDYAKSTSEVMINLADKPNGFYKIIIETDNNELAWHSVYKLDSVEDEGYKYW